MDGKDLPAYRSSTDKKEDAKKEYAEKKKEATTFSAVLGKDGPPHLMSTDMEEDAENALSALDGKDLPACLLSTDKKEDAKKVYAGQKERNNNVFVRS